MMVLALTSAERTTQLVAIISLVLSAGAALMLARAAWHGIPDFRVAFAASAAWAAVYCVSYVWLSMHPQRAADWSAVMRPVGMMSWAVAWALPGAISVRVWSRTQRAIAKGDDG